MYVHRYLTITNYTMIGVSQGGDTSEFDLKFIKRRDDFLSYLISAHYI